jgi:ribosome-associated protein
MTKVNKAHPQDALVQSIINGILEVKGHDVVVLDLRSIKHAVADYFIVCHGNSHTQVQAIARSVEETVMKELGDKPWHSEGLRNARWVLMDYLNAVVHVFFKEERENYALEELWADATIRAIETRA